MIDWLNWLNAIRPCAVRLKSFPTGKLTGSNPVVGFGKISIVQAARYLGAFPF
jgi:hypothetical protein